MNNDTFSAFLSITAIHFWPPTWWRPNGQIRKCPKCDVTCNGSILGHDRLHPVNRLSKPHLLRSTTPSIWLNHSIKWGLPGLQSLHAHTKYTARVQLCMGIGFRLTPTHKPHKHYDKGKRLHPFEPCHEKGHPLMHLQFACFSAGGVPTKRWIFSPKSALHIWWFSNIWTISWENCPFSSKWNHLWYLKASLAIKGLKRLTCIPNRNVLFNLQNFMLIKSHDTSQICGNNYITIQWMFQNYNSEYSIFIYQLCW